MSTRLHVPRNTVLMTSLYDRFSPLLRFSTTPAVASPAPLTMRPCIRVARSNIASSSTVGDTVRYPVSRALVLPKTVGTAAGRPQRSLGYLRTRETPRRVPALDQAIGYRYVLFNLTSTYALPGQPSSPTSSDYNSNCVLTHKVANIKAQKDPAVPELSNRPLNKVRSRTQRSLSGFDICRQAKAAFSPTTQFP